MIGKPLYFDFSGEPPDPDWIVDGLFERGTLTLLVGAPGTSKSFLCESLVVALVQGKPWLGHGTHGRRVIYVDEENHAREVQTRLHGLGMTNADRDGLRYYCRQGVRIGEDQWADGLREELDEFEADVLIVDTATSALALASMNDNSEVGAIMRTLRGLCGTGVAVILLHHENKLPDRAKRSARTAFQGAQAWQGQADQHLALSTKMEEPEERRLANGRTERRFVLRLEAPKNRGGKALLQGIELLSEHGPDDKPIPGRTRVGVVRR